MKRTTDLDSLLVFAAVLFLRGEKEFTSVDGEMVTAAGVQAMFAMLSKATHKKLYEAISRERLAMRARVQERQDIVRGA